MEIWKDIPGYEGLYQVSDMGRVKSLKRATTSGRILKGRVKECGHVNVFLCKDGHVKTHYVHSLVLLAFVGSRPANAQTRHLNSIPTDNRLCNLAYGSCSENMNDRSKSGNNSKRKLSVYDVKEIRRRLADGERPTAIARDYKVAHTTVTAIASGKNYKWV